MRCIRTISRLNNHSVTPMVQGLHNDIHIVELTLKNTFV